jgi:LuxR family maltose regulon positive regulatory protein
VTRQGSDAIVAPQGIDWHQIASLAKSRTYLAEGEAELAEAEIQSTSDRWAQWSHRNATFVRLSTLGEIYYQQGRLHLAAATYQPLLDWVDEQPPNLLLFQFFYRLCALYYEWNQPAKAKQYYAQCLRMIEQENLPQRWSVPALIGLAWCLWAEGMTKAADQQLQKAGLLVRRTQQAALSEQMRTQRARFWLRRGNVVAAARLFTAEEFSPDKQCLYQHQETQLTVARILIHQGRAGEALRLLDPYARRALDSGRVRDLIEILVLQALSYQAMADSANASAALANALCRAEREGFVRTFVDEGEAVRGLLQQSATQGITLLYVHDLLAAFPQAEAGASQKPTTHLVPSPDSTVLVERLTLRELEVLSLVAAGESNEAIASQLTIALATVKKHLGNILGKLGVKNRTQAAITARELGLI